MDRKLIDAANRGALFDKTPIEARNLISIMDSNTQQFGTIYDDAQRKKKHHVKACGICTSPEHVTDMCPTLQEPPAEHVDVLGDLESQISQLASSVSKLESQCNLSSQTIVNPKQNASAIVLRSGKELQENTEENRAKRGQAQKKKPKNEVQIPQDQDDEAKKDNPKVLVTRPPFPERFTKSKKEEEEKEILETFRKVEVNIPLLDAIKQIPTVADRSVVYPEGVLEDVLVQVNELVFPADFYVLDMREDNSPNSTSILLGRPFLKTARTKIDVHSGALSMEFDGEIIKFNIYDSMRYPSDIPTALLIDIVDPFVQALSSTNGEGHVKFMLEESLTPMLAQILEEDLTVDPNICESVFELESLSSLPLNLAFIELPQSRTKLVPSVLQAPTLELKELPKHLKYAYLG
ncbi:hypothetical protein Sango_2867000 [Sesamum angolense]|uniref:Reverse transcriptase domain-containing protein n=1 Tax=Sesamum angolense TaxID=2727404 RepID=A0AAE1T6E8_9LAMI|nr:hypothetical protein Sango_2867000 [Sesamum angolense]